jgi:DNA polymerase
MVEISLDFETFSECDLKTSGAWKYSEHESTEILLASYCVHSDPDKIYTWRYDYNNIQEMSVLFDIILSDEDYLVHAWNANFERAIYENVAVKKLKWPEINFKNWVDDMAVAAYYARPLSLAKCGMVVAEKEQAELKDTQGKSLIRKFSVPNKNTKLYPENRVHAQDAPEDFESFVAYNKQDIIAETATVQKLPTQNLPELEQLGWAVDSQINKNGVLVDTKFINSAIMFLEKYKTERLEELRILTNGRVTSANQNTKMREWLCAQGSTIEDLKKETIEQYLQSEEIENLDNALSIKKVLEIRQHLGKSSNAKYVAMKNALSKDSTIKGAFLYLGATRTGRWAGRLVQFQNLPRRKPLPDNVIDKILENDYEFIKEYASSHNSNVFDLLSSGIRQVIVAPENQMLGVVDYSSIENRIAAWLSADTNDLELFKKGHDQYKAFASILFNTTYEKVTKDQRNLAKPVVLGAAYGMWTAQLQSSAKSFGIKLTEAEALIQLRKYHASHPNIKKVQKALEEAAKKAIRTPNKHFKVGREGFGHVKYIRRGNDLYCILPSGRSLCYPECQINLVKKVSNSTKLEYTVEVISYANEISGKWLRTETHGAKLFENICQAISRDILLPALINLHNAGFRVYGTVHDEIIAALTKEQTLDEMIKLMLDKPKWAETLPLAAEGFISFRYEKR